MTTGGGISGHSGEPSAICIRVVVVGWCTYLVLIVFMFSILLRVSYTPGVIARGRHPLLVRRATRKAHTRDSPLLLAQEYIMVVDVTTSFPPHPLEITCAIAGHCDTLDLLSLLLTNSLLNDLLTPLLYESIELTSWDIILRCLETLAPSPDTCVFGRDRAALVKTFIISIPKMRKPWYCLEDTISTTFVPSLRRMVNLRHFSCRSGFDCSSDLLFMLATGCSPSLRSLDLRIANEIPSQLDAMCPSEVHRFRPSGLRNLHTLKLSVPDWSLPLQNVLIHNVIHSCSESLKVLAVEVVGNQDCWESLLPRDGDFLSLQDLTLNGDALTTLLSRRATTVHTLNVLDRPPPDYNLPPDTFPELCDLTCPSAALSAFLSARSTLPRAVSSVSLDGTVVAASFLPKHRREYPPSWRRVLASLALLQYSAVPVTTVSFAVSSIRLDDMALAMPYLSTVEELAIAMDSECDQVSARPSRCAHL